MKTLISQLRPALVLTLFFVLITGLAFPFAITGIARLLFPRQAAGSLIIDSSGQVFGSSLIGQWFESPEYFHPRPSAAGAGYDAASSGGTNLGPTSDRLINGADGFDGVKQLAEEYRHENGLAPGEIVPVDAVTRSASGLDPHISVENAKLQASRIARSRGVPTSTIEDLIDEETEGPLFGVFGERRVNVLALNLALKGIVGSPNP